MTETSIAPIEEAWVLAYGLEKTIDEFISAADGFKKEAERTNDWVEYHKCIARIDAYKDILRLIQGANIKRKE